MALKNSPVREDENLRRMLKAPPKPHSEMKVSKAKPSRAIRTAKMRKIGKALSAKADVKPR